MIEQTKSCSWVVVEEKPNPSVIKDEGFRMRIAESHGPWRIRHMSCSVDLLLIPSGDFEMGESYDDWEVAELPMLRQWSKPADFYQCERPRHRVKIARPFYIGETAVTQAQWCAVLGANANPSANPKCDASPVDQVKYQNGSDFAQKLGCRLPTEAEWEFACRAGVQGRHYGVPGIDLNEIAWHAGNSKSGDSKSTHPVKEKLPNALGLYDMLGNVWEWCADWSDPKYFQQCTDKGCIVDPAGPQSGTKRIVRGGSFRIDSTECRASFRGAFDPSSPPTVCTGMRLACDVGTLFR